MVPISSPISTFSAAILLITMTTGLFASRANWNILRVFVSMPAVAPMTRIAVSAAGMEVIAGPVKSG